VNLRTFITSALLLGSVLTEQANEPIRLHPDNPHYFLWRGQPTVLITSGEHYGAVLNADFDYAKYLETLAKKVASTPPEIARRTAAAQDDFDGWNLEPGLNQAQLVMVARVVSISRVTIIEGAKTDLALREYRFQPVRRLKGLFQRDQLSMTAADLGSPADDGPLAPPLKEGEFRLLILAQQQGRSMGCVSAASGATSDVFVFVVGFVFVYFTVSVVLIVNGVFRLIALLVVRFVGLVGHVKLVQRRHEAAQMAGHTGEVPAQGDRGVAGRLLRLRERHHLRATPGRHRLAPVAGCVRRSSASARNRMRATRLRSSLRRSGSPNRLPR
jgi:hypothetical protein